MTWLSEAVLLFAIALFAVWKLLGHLLPGLAVSLQQRMADQLARERMPRLLRRYGQWLRSAPAAAAASGCGSVGGGCSACKGCGSVRSAASVQPLPFPRNQAGSRRR